MSKTRVIIGKKYGLLTPMRVVGRNKHGLLIYECLCDCGNVKNIGSRYITDGRIVSCGCKRSRSKGMYNSLTYKSWISAKQRCINPNNHNYPNYGGRGVKMCSRWLESFASFLEDMGERPSRDYTLDRIDVNGDYEPSNCRWSTHRTQSNNRRDNVFLDVNGKKLTVSEFAVKYNLNRSNVAHALRRGMSVAEIIARYKALPMEFEEVEELSQTNRGIGSYGSTGK